MAKKKKIMRSLTIKELSGVDRPAQVGAKALIMKRADPEDVNKDDDDELTPEYVADLMKRGKAALTTAIDGHTHLVLLEDFNEKEVVSGITTWQDEHQHPWILRDDGRIIIGTVDDHTHEVDELSKIRLGTGDSPMTKEEQAAADALKKSNDDLIAKNAKADKVIALTAANKAHYDGLTEEADQDTFLAKSVEDQDAEVLAIAKAKTDADPVVYKTKDGLELRKSVGVAVIEMAKSNDLLREQNDTLRKKQESAEFEKRAEEELPHLPGTVQERGAMLKAIDGIEDETQKKAALNALKANNEAMSKAFETGGVGLTPVEAGSAEGQINALAKKHHEANPTLTIEQSTDAVLKTDAGAKLYEKSLN